MLRIDVDAPITICHHAPGRPEKTITIAREALPFHLAHGDTIGICPGPREPMGPFPPFREPPGIHWVLTDPSTYSGVYGIPQDNPFVGTAGLDEIYAYGLRNPFKFAFDDGPGGDGALWLADVGQDLFEEVDIIVHGGNYGWLLEEGLHCFDPFDPVNPPTDCPHTGPLGEALIAPIAEYAHPFTGFLPVGGITVIGGFVYRGAVSPKLEGRYVFGDFAQDFVSPTGTLYYLEETASGAFEMRRFVIGSEDLPYGLFLKGFGEDEDGEIYVCGSLALAPYGDTGVVQHLVVVP